MGHLSFAPKFGYTPCALKCPIFLLNWKSSESKMGREKGVRNFSAGQNPDVNFGEKINKPARLV